MDYKHAAQQVLDCIGGKDNILSAAHCATRLRLVIADNAKVNKQELENAEGAKGVFEAQGQLQIIFGTGTVNKVYDEFIQLAGIEGGSKEDVKQAAAAKAPWYQRAIKTLGDIFVPIIPAIVASGFLMGIMEALNFMVNNGFLNIDTTGSVYVFAKLFSNTAYTFLPILIACSAAKVFGGNPYLGAVIGMIMIHPDLQNAWTVSNGVNVMQPVFGGLYAVPLVGYQGHVIPVIIAVWLMCQIEKRLHKVVPAMFDLFVTPLVSVFVTGYLTLAAIGPVFTKLENGIITGSAEYAADGLCVLTNLARSTMSKAGDQIITTGLGGVFPPDVLVGVIKELTPEASGKSMLAVIKPGADPRTVRHVFIITNY